MPVALPTPRHADPPPHWHHGILAEWLRRLIRNQLGTFPREFESLRCRLLLILHGAKVFFFSPVVPPLRIQPGAVASGTRGAMDSAPDFESGGCGFESRRVCFFSFWIAPAHVFSGVGLPWNSEHASIAQLAEHVPRKHKVTSSILVGGFQRAVGLEV